MPLNIHPATIGFDFDGVIADTVEAFLRIACEQYAYCGIRPEDITDFSVEECLPMGARIAESIFMQILCDSVGNGLRPMPGAVDVLCELSRQAPVTIITARPEAQPVHHWLDEVFPAQARARLKVIAMGDHDDKARYIKRAGLTTFIDDRAETCMRLRQEGLNPIVFAQPWNRNRHTLPAVHSWEEIHNLCF